MENKGARILIVDDEPNALKILSAILNRAGYTTIGVSNVDRAIKILEREEIDTIITDLKMPDQDGMDLFDYVKANFPDIPVIFLTAYGTVESAVKAITDGAFYYFIKPPDYNKLKGILARAVEQRLLKKEISELRKKLYNNRQHRIIGTTPQIRKIFELIEALRDTESSVLIHGETGTGKELIARALHYSSNRANLPFVTVNCAAIPKELMESELFGYEKGAFTGAVTQRKGKIEEVDGGTLFLDEIGELELSLQAKLLRVIQERELERIGNNKKIKANFRLISSTNRDLRREVKEGRFREDLYYRINVVDIKVPPLRERRDDIPLLTIEFVKEFNEREGKNVYVSDEVIRAFQRYNWPGNVRQLRNVIERAIVMSKVDNINLIDLPEEFHIIDLNEREAIESNGIKTIKELEKEAIIEALRKCRGNKSKASKILGISRKAFYKRLKDFKYDNIFLKELNTLSSPSTKAGEGEATNLLNSPFQKL
ncbi:MAG: sigma-54-dependent transcriptional regulator [Thermodesulfovibrionales bacterium]